MKNSKAFLKERSLKANWDCTNQTVKVIVYVLAFILICLIFEFFVSKFAALFILCYGIGFAFGWYLRRLKNE